LGKPFPFKFDRRHIFNYQTKLILGSEAKKERSLNLAIFYVSGNHVTIPVAKYDGILPFYWNQMEPNSTITPAMDENAYLRQEMSSINGFNMSDNFRIDIGYSLLKRKKKYNKEFSFSIYNVLNRQNPFLVFYDKGKWKQLSLLPMVPSVKWRVFF